MVDGTPRFITAAELAEMLGVALVTIYRQVERGILPAPVYVGERASRWRLDEVLAVLEARRATPRQAYARGMRRQWRPGRRAAPAAAAK